jgi:hypothetical protein
VGNSGNVEQRVVNALSAMWLRVRELQVSGVALVAYENQPLGWQVQIMVMGRLERQPEPDKRGADDKGTNYIAVASSKLAEMVSTGMNSGSASRPLLNGELGYQGGVVRVNSAGLRFYTSFSGATPEQDVLIAQAGMEVLCPKSPD